jgi:hypothetical protein
VARLAEYTGPANRPIRHQRARGSRPLRDNWHPGTFGFSRAFGLWAGCGVSSCCGFGYTQAPNCRRAVDAELFMVSSEPSAAGANAPASETKVR